MTIMAETISVERLEELVTDDSIPVVHRALWTLLWESELRVLDLLALEVQDIALEKRAVVPSSGAAQRGGQSDFSERAAGILRELVADRKSGLLFAVGERALTWEEAVKAAGECGLAIHAFRTGGKMQRKEGD